MPPIAERYLLRMSGTALCQIVEETDRLEEEIRHLSRANQVRTSKWRQNIFFYF